MGAAALSTRLDCHGEARLRHVVAVVLAALIALAGCATIENPLSQQDIAALRLTEVEVKYAPDYHIHWLKAEQEYADKVKPGLRERSMQKEPGAGNVDQGDDPYLVAIKSPEGQAFIRERLTGALKDRVKSQIMPKLASGTRVVKFEVEVHSFVIPSAVQRVVIGGTPMLGARVYLRDAKTGAQLAKLDRMAAGMAGNGALGVLVDQAFGDLEDRVFDKWTENVESWLLKKGA